MKVIVLSASYNSPCLPAGMMQFQLVCARARHVVSHS